MAIGILVPIAFVAHARWTNGALGFPLDDAWIPLGYARTLREHGTFAYFTGAPHSTGTTAPLFALLESVGFLLTSNEKLLAIVLGLMAQAAFLITFARWAWHRLRDVRWVALAVALVALDGRVALLSVSGMETSLFLALAALAIERRLAGRPLGVGLALGGALWVRPDAWILAAVLAIDAVIAVGRGERPDTARAPLASAGAPLATRPLTGVLLFAILAIGYVVWNLVLGGRPLPTSFLAKVSYYAARPRSAFLTDDVAQCFASGAWLLLAPFAIVALARDRWSFALRRGSLRLEAGWLLALPLAYLVLLPYAHRFTRYLVPALVPLAILAVAGLKDVSAARWGTRSLRRFALAALLVAASARQAWLLADSEGFYRYACRYHAERHEAAGRWLAAHTPPDAVVATHDVGAIAYYSHRRIIDAAGLVSREVTPWVGRPGYTDSLTELFDRRGVTYLAVFEDWLPVEGVRPLAVFNRDAEVMRIYPWEPGQTVLRPTVAAASSH